MGKLRDLIVSKVDLRYEIVEIPQWECSIKVQGLTAKQRSELMRTSFIGNEVNLDIMYPKLVLASCYDPETDELIFDAGDAELIMSKSGEVVEKLASTAMKLSGLSAESKIGKN